MEEDAEEDDEVELEVVAKVTGHLRVQPILTLRWRFVTCSPWSHQLLLMSRLCSGLHR